MRWDAGYIRYLIAIYPYLEAGRWPPSDRAADKRARGALKYGSCPPTSTVLDKAMLDQAIRQLDEPYRTIVQARIIGRSNGRAARLLGRRQDDVRREFDRALELLAELAEGPATGNKKRPAWSEEGDQAGRGAGPGVGETRRDRDPESGSGLMPVVRVAAVETGSNQQDQQGDD